MRRHLLLAYLSLIAICLLWGTTYLGIRVALESLPPLVLVSARFTISGGLLLAAALARGLKLPRGRALLLSAVTGWLILGVGNCCLTFAELWIPSGLAALIVTVSPFWMVGIESLMPDGERLSPRVAFGMFIGLAGSALLIAPDLSAPRGAGSLLKAFLLLQLGCASWSFGSVYQRRQNGAAHPLVTSAVQQLAAGLGALPLAAVFSRGAVNITLPGVSAVAYLVVFGSIVGYSAYIYALEQLPVALVSIYSYVNPVVAVILGWLFYREPFNWRQGIAMLIIFAGVAMVKLSSPRQRASVPAEYACSQGASQRRRDRETNKTEHQREQQLHGVAHDL